MWSCTDSISKNKSLLEGWGNLLNPLINSGSPRTERYSGLPVFSSFFINFEKVINFFEVSIAISSKTFSGSCCDNSKTSPIPNF